MNKLLNLTTSIFATTPAEMANSIPGDSSIFFRHNKDETGVVYGLIKNPEMAFLNNPKRYKDQVFDQAVVTASCHAFTKDTWPDTIVHVCANTDGFFKVLKPSDFDRGAFIKTIRIAIEGAGIGGGFNGPGIKGGEYRAGGQTAVHFHTVTYKGNDMTALEAATQFVSDTAKLLQDNEDFTLEHFVLSRPSFIDAVIKDKATGEKSIINVQFHHKP